MYFHLFIIGIYYNCEMYIYILTAFEYSVLCCNCENNFHSDRHLTTIYYSLLSLHAEIITLTRPFDLIPFICFVVDHYNVKYIVVKENILRFLKLNNYN